MWKGSLSKAPSNPVSGWAYYDTTQKKSFIYDGTSWQIIAQDGLNGADGIDGSNGADGSSYPSFGYSIVWKGSLSEAPSNPVSGWAYYDTTQKKSFIYDGTSWQIIAQDGLNGADGADGIDGNSDGSSSGYSIVWKGSLSEAPSNPVSGWAYYDTTQKKSFIYDGTSWQIIAQDGLNGADGADGIDGNSGGSSSGYSIVWKGSLSEAPSNPVSGWAYYDTTQKKSFIYDGTSWQIIAQDGADGNDGHDGNSGGGNSSVVNGLTYIETTEETIDGETYRVESYADVMSPDGYLYTYYKYYYKNNKLRRLYCFFHAGGNCLNYHYTEFEEHVCNENVSSTKYTYDENGKLKTLDSYSNGKLSSSRTYYENGNMKTSDSYSDGKLISSRTYYDNGKTETEKIYSDGELSLSHTYYENGNMKTSDSYSNGKLNWSRTYYDNGNMKTLDSYSNGELSSSEGRYSNNEYMYKISYNAKDNTISAFYYYYETSYLKYYYTSGYVYEYGDGVTKSSSTSASIYSSKTECSDEEAKALIAVFKM